MPQPSLIEVDFTTNSQQSRDLAAAYQILGIPVTTVECLGGTSIRVPETVTATQRRDARLLAFPRPTPAWANCVGRLIA